MNNVIDEKKVHQGITYLIKDGRFWSVLVGIVVYLLSYTDPRLAAHADKIGDIIAVLVSILVLGQSADTVLHQWRKEPRSIGALLQEALSEVIISEGTSTGTEPTSTDYPEQPAIPIK